MATPTTKAAFIASLLSGIAATTDDLQKATVIMGDESLIKAAQTLRPGEEVKDLWENGEFHRAPSKEEIKTGPAQHSSGSGAEKMIAEYSNPAPQDGTVTVPMQLANELGQMRGYMKSQGDMITALGKSVNGLTTAMTGFLTAQATADDVGDDVIKAFSTRYAAKAQQALQTARKLISKAAKVGEDLDEKLGDERKACKAQIKELRLGAASMLCKAHDYSLAARFGDTDPAAEVRKGVEEVLDANPAVKADVNAFGAKDGEKDHEKMAERKMKKEAKKAAKKAAAKAATKAAKAGGGEMGKTVDPGTAAKAEGENTNQKETNQANGVTKAELDKVVEGMGMLQMSVADMLSHVTGKPLTANTSTPLTLIKGGADTTSKLEAIAERLEDDNLEGPVIMKGKDLLSKLTAVHEGKMDPSVFNSFLMSAPIQVRQIFAEAAA